MPFLMTSRALFGKRESVAGTSSDPLDKTNSYASPEAQDVRIRDLTFSVETEKDNEDSKYLTGDYTGDESIIGKTNGAASFSIKGAPAEWDSSGGVSANVHRLNYAKYLETAGMELIVIGDGITPDADYTYRKQYMFFPSTSAAVNTITLTEVVKNEDETGIATEVKGAVGNITMSAEGTGMPLMFNFEMEGSTAYGEDGVWEISPSDMANLVFDDSAVMKTVAEKFLDTSIEITDLETDSSIEFCSKSLSLNSANTIVPIDCQGSTSGEKHRLITEMKPRFTISPQLRTLTEFEYWKGMVEQHKYRIDVKFRQNDADGIHTFRIVIPNAQLLTSPRADESGLITQELTFRPLRNVEKFVPSINYIDQTTGLPTAWSNTGTSLEGREAEAMWYLIVAEEEVQ